MSSKSGKQPQPAQPAPSQSGEAVPHAMWERMTLAIAFLRKGMFAHLKRHGNSKCEPLTLAMLAILWSWGTTDQTVDARFQVAASLVQSWCGSAFVFTTYKGFIGALATWNSELIRVVTIVLQQQLLTLNCWERSRGRSGRPLFAIDGTKVGVPWTASTDRHLGQQTLCKRKKKQIQKKRKAARAKSAKLKAVQERAAKQKSSKQKSANSQAHQEVRPQLLLTLVWHMASGLPWSWKSGPVSANERDQARALIASFPLLSILVCDAGFTGYEFWKEIMDAGHDFVIRVGSNVRLLKNLGWKVKVKGNLAYLWPDKKQKSGAAPLVVRLVTFQTAKTTIWLATSILDVKVLGDEELAEIYKQRWGIEGWFRSLKQTFGRRTLRSRDARHAECELDWSIVGLALIQQQGVRALEADGQSPDRLSEAEAIRAVRSTILYADFGLAQLPTLVHRLQGAVLDTYTRTKPKQGHHIHRKKAFELPGQPEIIEATAEQIAKARQIQAAKGAA